MPRTDEALSIRLLFAGDVMLGRRVTPVAEREGPQLFEQIRHVVSSADLAFANLESPATTAAHISDNPNDLRAPPELVGLLSGAGFDGMSVANNHSGDAGSEGFRETLEALRHAGIDALGVAAEDATAIPIRYSVSGVTVSLLAYDATRLGMAPTSDRLGTAIFDVDHATTQVTHETTTSDLVVVSLHGGIEYLLDSDPILEEAARSLVGVGADIVWGHGPHVVQSVAADSNAVVATSLGNLLFDQTGAGTQDGQLLEVLASADGPIAYRLINTSHGNLRLSHEGSETPVGDAVLLDREWWTLVRTPELAPNQAINAGGFPWGSVTTARLGPVTRPDLDFLVVSYRHPFRETEVNQLYPTHDFTDESGMSAHVGVFDPQTYEPIWGAGTLLRPVADLTVCHGSLALAFDSLDDSAVVATSAWTWHGFGFQTAPELPGPGSPGCADVDGDGSLEPVITNR